MRLHVLGKTMKEMRKIKNHQILVRERRLHLLGTIIRTRRRKKIE